MTWKSAINDGPDPEDEGYDEWVERVMAEPWVAALEDLIKWSGLWVGTEEQLILEVKTRVGKKVAESEDFPSSFERLLAYQDYAIDGFCWKGFGLLDYRELTVEDLDDFDAPGWSEEAPVLVCRGRAAHRPDFRQAQYEILKYWHPVPSAFLEFTASKHFGEGRTWTGTTEKLAKALAKHHPTNYRVPRIALDRARPEGVDDLFPEFGSIEEINAMMEPYGREEHLVFFKQVKKWAPILEEVGIKISRQKRRRPPSMPESNNTELPQRTYWTIERPLWERSDPW